MTTISQLKDAKWAELVVCVEDLQDRLRIIHARAKERSVYGPTVGALATEVDMVLAQLRLLETPAVVSAEVKQAGRQ